jgi:hypothetical protein
MWENIHRIAFELSNICPYSGFHDKCPLSLETKEIIMPSRVFYDTMDYLKSFGWHGTVCFQNYNEPLADPRLQEFVRYAHLMGCSVLLWTNGYCLTQTLATELVRDGVSSFEVSCYSDEEHQRLNAIDVGVPYHAARRGLDDRLGIYDAPKNGVGPCPRGAPMSDMVIRRTGAIALCCLDWAGKHDMPGSLEENAGLIAELYAQLKSGDRRLDLCQRCTW